jgi:oxygen-independent coproporphyrinogen-3 oxidase
VNLGLYVHVPFCERKCAYCDFFSLPAVESSVRDRYVDALCTEIRGKATHEPAATVFFGGGTPSVLTPAQIGRILDALRAGFALAPDAEVSMEANPETVTEATFRGYRDAGVNRVSLGVQTLDDAILRVLGRIHDAARARAAIREAASAGFTRLGADLMFGLPGQTPERWRADLREVLGWPIEHLSAYEFSVEPETPFAAQTHILPDEDAVLAMWDLLLEETTRAGFLQYEVSNYARPGAECRHNLGYWHDGEWLGFGAGAWSARAGVRTGNPRDLGRYFAGAASGFPPAETDVLPPERQAAETMVLGLRLREGVDLAAFEARWGAAALARLESALAPHLAAGRLERVAGRLRLTRKGLLVANDVWSDLVGA